MKRKVFIKLAVAFVLALLIGCEGFKKGFDEGYCNSFKESFIKSCNDACSKNKPLSECDPYCKGELPKQESYANRCLKK